MRTIAGAAGWILIAIVPVFPIVMVLPDLQGSRYLYLATVGWAVLVVTLTRFVEQRLVRRIMLFAIVGLLFLSATAVRLEVTAWKEAALVRDRVLHALRTDKRLESCSSVTLEALPDNVRGAYVFRNGAAEAVSAELRTGVVPSAGAECTFTWNAAAGAFDRRQP
jgi:hypothetical protein